MRSIATFKSKFRTPDVVEFAVSPQAEQAVLACPPAPNQARCSNRLARRRAPPAPPAKLSPSKGMAQPIFPASVKLRGDIGSSEIQRRVDDSAGLVPDRKWIAAVGIHHRIGDGARMRIRRRPLVLARKGPGPGSGPGRRRAEGSGAENPHPIRRPATAATTAVRWAPVCSRRRSRRSRAGADTKCGHKEVRRKLTIEPCIPIARAGQTQRCVADRKCRRRRAYQHHSLLRIAQPGARSIHAKDHR